MQLKEREMFFGYTMREKALENTTVGKISSRKARGEQKNDAGWSQWILRGISSKGLTQNTRTHTFGETCTIYQGI